MAELDQTARYALQTSPTDSVDWLLPGLDQDLGFRRWLETEMIAFPGEPARRCDTVAELVSKSGQQAPWALVMEVEATPRSTMAARLLEYQVRALRKLRHGPRRRDRYQVAALLIGLTGRKRWLKLRMRLPGTKIGLIWKVPVISLPNLGAAATLERIARGELGRGVLPWIPLMAGGCEDAVIAEWVRLANGEPAEERRRDYRGLALVFADKAGCLVAWKKALEGVDMWQSQIIREWKDEARQEAKRSDLLKVLRAKFKTEVPADLAEQVGRTTDLDVLERWFDASLAASSLEEFRAALPGPANGASS